MECSVNAKGVERQIVVDYNFGEDLNDAIQATSEATIFNHYIASAKLSVNSFVRPMLNAKNEDESFTYSDDEVREALTKWVLPDKTGRSVDKGAKALKMLQGLSPEKRAEILALLGEV